MPETVAARPGAPRPDAARQRGRADRRSRKRSPAPLPGRPTRRVCYRRDRAGRKHRAFPPADRSGGDEKNENGRGGLRHHGPRGSNRSPPASGVDRCETDADWVWGKPRTFLGIRINALGLAPPTECGDRMFEVRYHQEGLGRSSRVAAAGRIRRQESFRQTTGGDLSRFPRCPTFRYVRSTPTGRPDRPSARFDR